MFLCLSRLEWQILDYLLYRLASGLLALSTRKWTRETYDHGVETSTRETGRANKVLSRLELILEVHLAFDRAVGLSGAIVEALVDC